MAGLVPGIHVSKALSDGEPWMAGTRPAMTGKKKHSLV